MQKRAILADQHGRLVEVWETDPNDVERADEHQANSGIAPQHRVHVEGAVLLPSLPGIVVRLNRAMDWIPEG